MSEPFPPPAGLISASLDACRDRGGRPQKWGRK